MLGHSATAEAPLAAAGDPGNFGTAAGIATVSGAGAALAAATGTVSALPVVDGVLETFAAATGTISVSAIVTGTDSELFDGTGSVSCAATVSGDAMAASVGAGAVLGQSSAFAPSKYFIVQRDIRNLFGDSPFPVERRDVIFEDA